MVYGRFGWKSPPVQGSAEVRIIAETGEVMWPDEMHMTVACLFLV
jgi:hypothetical protein